MTNESDSEHVEKRPKKLSYKSPLAVVGYIVAITLLLTGGLYSYQYVASPDNIRYPSFDHYHFRTKIVVSGRSVDFSRDEFQEDITTDATSCSTALNGTPIDFHDKEDQMTHVHWGGITGGQFLKYYGWNLIGGKDNSLGRRYDQGMMRTHQVNIKDDALPEMPKDAKFYVYIGDEDSYEQKAWKDFLDMDLEDFFGKKSNVANNNTSYSILNLFSQKAYAHGAVEDGDGEEDEATLERINNLIGNVVIFVENKEPSFDEIREQFSNPVPLHNSTCGG